MISLLAFAAFPLFAIATGASAQVTPAPMSTGVMGVLPAAYIGTGTATWPMRLSKGSGTNSHLTFVTAGTDCIAPNGPVDNTTVNNVKLKTVLDGKHPLNQTIDQTAGSSEVHPFSLNYTDASSANQSIFQYINGSNRTFGVFASQFGGLYQTDLNTGGTTWTQAFTFNVSGALPTASSNLNFFSKNTGGNSSVGSNFNYQSTSAGNDGGFDVGRQNIAVFNPSSYPTTPLLKDENFSLAISPNDFGTTGHKVATLIAEWNIVNRGPDTGFMRDRTGRDGVEYTGGLLMVPENANFGYGGKGSNVTWAFIVSASGGNENSNSGDITRFYTAYQIDPNAIAAGGRGAYFNGDATGTTSKFPYAPLQVAYNWQHGFDTATATIQDNVALNLAQGQSVAFDANKTGMIYENTAGQLVHTAPIVAPAVKNSSQAWTSYTPSFSNSSPGSAPPTYSLLNARYSRTVDATVRFTMTFQVTSVGTASGQTRVTLPSTNVTQTMISCGDKNSGSLLYAEVEDGVSFFSISTNNNPDFFVCSGVYESQ